MMSTRPGWPRLSSTGRAWCSRVDTRSGPPAVTRVEVGHAAPEQWVPVPEVVVDVQAGDHRGDPGARLVHAQQLGHGVEQHAGRADCQPRRFSRRSTRRLWRRITPSPNHTNAPNSAITMV